MLDSAMPYYQSELGDRLGYEITLNHCNRVIKSSTTTPKKPYAEYKVANISLEYDIVTQPDFARCIKMEYQSMVLPYDRILRHNKIVDKFMAHSHPFTS